jgi:hypothetical protein
VGLVVVVELMMLVLEEVVLVDPVHLDLLQELVVPEVMVYR